MRKHDVTNVALLYYDPLLRDIVRQAFSDDAAIHVVAELPAENVSIAELRAAQPDVVVVDQRSFAEQPPLALTALLGTLTLQLPRVRVVALSLADASVTVLSGQRLADASLEQFVTLVRGQPAGHAPARALAS